MMKKLGMIIFVMALVAAFALPAFAYTVEGAKGERFTMGGAFVTDLGWRNTDKNFNTIADTTHGAAVERTQFFAILSQSSLLNGSFVVGDVSANWVLATQSSLQASNMQVNPTGSQNQKDNDIIDQFYGTYKFGNSYILAGKIGSTWTTWMSPAVLGYSSGTGTHINSIAYGATYDNKYPQLRFGQTLSPMVSYYLALVTTGTYAADPNTGATVTTLSYSQMPAIAAKVTLNFGSVMVIPGMIYQQVKWDSLPAGWDNSMTSWHVTLPVRAAFGPFVGLFTVGFGQNDGGPTGSVSMASDSSNSGFQRNPTTGTIYNTSNFNAQVDLSFAFGPVTPHVFYTMTTATNSDRWTVGDNKTTRSSMGINAYYKINNNFTVIPEFALYDLGVIPNNAAKTEYGKDWLAGVQFRFSF